MSWLNFMNIVFFDGTSVDASWFVRIRCSFCFAFADGAAFACRLNKICWILADLFSTNFVAGLFCRHLHSLMFVLVPAGVFVVGNPIPDGVDLLFV